MPEILNDQTSLNLDSPFVAELIGADSKLDPDCEISIPDISDLLPEPTEDIATPPPIPILEPETTSLDASIPNEEIRSPLIEDENASVDDSSIAIVDSTDAVETVESSGLLTIAKSPEKENLTEDVVPVSQEKEASDDEKISNADEENDKMAPLQLSTDSNDAELDDECDTTTEAVLPTQTEAHSMDISEEVCSTSTDLVIENEPKKTEQIPKLTIKLKKTSDSSITKELHVVTTQPSDSSAKIVPKLTIKTKLITDETEELPKEIAIPKITIKGLSTHSPTLSSPRQESKTGDFTDIKSNEPAPKLKINLTTNTVSPVAKIEEEIMEVKPSALTVEINEPAPKLKINLTTNTVSPVAKIEEEILEVKPSSLTVEVNEPAPKIKINLSTNTAEIVSPVPKVDEEKVDIKPKELVIDSCESTEPLKLKINLSTNTAELISPKSKIEEEIAEIIPTEPVIVSFEESERTTPKIKINLTTNTAELLTFANKIEEEKISEAIPSTSEVAVSPEEKESSEEFSITDVKSIAEASEILENSEKSLFEDSANYSGVKSAKILDLEMDNGTKSPEIGKSSILSTLGEDDITDPNSASTDADMEPNEPERICGFEGMLQVPDVSESNDPESSDEITENPTREEKSPLGKEMKKLEDVFEAMEENADSSSPDCVLTESTVEVFVVADDSELDEGLTSENPIERNPIQTLEDTQINEVEEKVEMIAEKQAVNTIEIISEERSDEAEEVVADVKDPLGSNIENADENICVSSTEEEIVPISTTLSQSENSISVVLTEETSENPIKSEHSILEDKLTEKKKLRSHRKVPANLTTEVEKIPDKVQPTLPKAITTRHQIKNSEIVGQVEEAIPKLSIKNLKKKQAPEPSISAEIIDISGDSETSSTPPPVVKNLRSQRILNKEKIQTPEPKKVKEIKIISETPPPPKEIVRNIVPKLLIKSLKTQKINEVKEPPPPSEIINLSDSSDEEPHNAYPELSITNITPQKPTPVTSKYQVRQRGRFSKVNTTPEPPVEAPTSSKLLIRSLKTQKTQLSAVKVDITPIKVTPKSTVKTRKSLRVNPSPVPEIEPDEIVPKLSIKGFKTQKLLAKSGFEIIEETEQEIVTPKVAQKGGRKLAELDIATEVVESTSPTESVTSKWLLALV